MFQGSFFVLALVLYLGVVVYLIILATRLVTAVERIARLLEGRSRPEV